MDLISLVNLFQDRLFIENKISRASIVLSGDSGSIVFPVPPSELPTIELVQNNTTFSSLSGDITLIGQMGLRTISMDLLLPNDCSKYSFASGDNADTIINFITRERANYNPLRLVITRGNNTYLNMQCVINKFSYSKDNVGDYKASFEFVEFRTQNPISGALES